MKIFGVSKSKGVMDNGTSFDKAVVFSIVRLKSSPNNAGFAGVQFDGVPAIYEKYLMANWPESGVLMDVEFEMQAGRKGEFTNVVVAMSPVKVSAAVPPSPSPKATS
jgi:hypothetical protein